MGKKSADAGWIASLGYGDAPAKRKNRQPGSLDDADALMRILDKLQGATLLDCRAKPGPASADDVKTEGSRKVWRAGQPIRVRHGFWRYQLQELLGDRYEWVGYLLGGPGGGVPGPTTGGIDMLVRRQRAGERLVLMCAEASPLHCHRHHQVAVAGDIWRENVNPRPLSARCGDSAEGVPVYHIFDATNILTERKQARFVQVFRASTIAEVVAGNAESYPVVSLDDFAAGERP